MSRTDLIADSLTMVRNAIQRKRQTVEIPGSNFLKEIAKILKQEGFIKNYRYIEDVKGGRLRIYLRYDADGKSFISEIKKVSKPGRRVYKKASDIPEVLSGMGICIVTTSKGVLTGRRAKELGVGGEIICEVW